MKKCFLLVVQREYYSFYELKETPGKLELSYPVPINGMDEIAYERDSLQDSLHGSLAGLCDKLNLKNDKSIALYRLESSDKDLNQAVIFALGNKFLNWVPLGAELKQWLKIMPEEDFPFINTYGVNYDGMNYLYLPENDELKARPFNLLGLTYTFRELLFWGLERKKCMALDFEINGKECDCSTHADDSSFFCMECGSFLKRELVPPERFVQDISMGAQLKIRRILFNLKNNCLHKSIMANRNVDCYARQIERLHLLLQLPEVENLDISWQMKTFLSECARLTKTVTEKKKAALKEKYENILSELSDFCSTKAKACKEIIDDCNAKIFEVGNKIAEKNNKLSEEQSSYSLICSMTQKSWNEKTFEERINAGLKAKLYFKMDYDDITFRAMAALYAYNIGILNSSLSKLKDELKKVRTQWNPTIMEQIYPLGVCEVLQFQLEESKMTLL